MKDGRLAKNPFREAPYSHGIHPIELVEKTGNSSRELVEAALRFLRKPLVIYSNDQVENSDIAQLLRNNGNTNNYKNLYLGDWIERDTNISHKIARDKKFEEAPVLHITCEFRKLHKIPLILLERNSHTVLIVAYTIV